ncbi:Uncharacterised protein [Mycobacteroides abscessus subsp. abscessus]|nr:Uncharacterised protein [Mycobacteroides abscessus subsp. abscessus]
MLNPSPKKALVSPRVHHGNFAVASGVDGSVGGAGSTVVPMMFLRVCRCFSNVDSTTPWKVVVNSVVLVQETTSDEASARRPSIAGSRSALAATQPKMPPCAAIISSPTR